MLKSKTIMVLLVVLFVALSAPATAQLVTDPPATPFATIPGGPIGVACIGDGPGGITDRLVVTSYCAGNIHTVSESGAVTTHFPTGFPKDWCGVESYLALSTGLGGWPVGDIYASFGPTVYKINSTLTSATPFVTIAGKPTTHTGVTFDRTGVWNFDMIVSFTDGTVYRVTPGGVATFVAQNTTPTGTHHESPRILPNDTIKWGAFAGCITTAAEFAHQVFAICNPSSPTVSTLAAGILNAESSDIRPAAGETTFGSTPYVYFGSRHSTAKIWGYPASSFPSGSAGDMFVSQEYGGGITRLTGPGAVSTFESAFGQHYEGSNFCFIPQAIDTSEKCSDGIDNDGDGLIDENDSDCHVCGDGNIDPGEQCDDGNIVSGDGCSSTCKLENKPPVAKCKDVTIAASDSCNGTVSVNDGSFDPDKDTITLSQTPAGPYGLGPNPVTLTVTDTKNASASCTATVTVVDQSPPAISCPAAQVVECTGNGSANVTVGSATATDNCSVASTSCTVGSGSYPLGTTSGTCTATDGSGNSSSCNTSVTVVDTTPPKLSCVESVNPSGKNVPKASNTNQDGFYKVSGGDVCSTPVIKIGSFTLANGETIKITQTPGKSGVSYVNTMGPAGIRHFQVGPGDAVITATDGSGNQTSVTCLVPPPPK